MESEIPADKRREVVARYLDQLCVHLAPLAGGGSAVIGDGDGLALDEWEVAAVRVAVVPFSGTVPAISNLMAEAMALRLKLAEDCQILEVSGVSSADPGTPLFETLVLDVAIGRHQLHDLQQECNLLVRDQRFDEAKRLSQFRSRLRDDVKRVEAFLEPPDPAAAEAEGSLQLDTAIHTVEEIEEQQARTGRRVAGLAAVVAILAVVWLAGMVIGARRPAELERLTVEDFQAIAPVVAVEARPPSLYVIVDGALWQNMGESERIGVVAAVGEIVEASRYTGALLRDRDGRTLGEWLLDTGSRLVPQGLATGS
jgi:hypothetical protein